MQTVEELQDLFILRYMDIMECNESWATEVMEMECSNPHDVSDVEAVLKQLCNVNGVTYFK